MFIKDGDLIGITPEEALQTVLEIPEEVKRIKSLKIKKEEELKKEESELESFSFDERILSGMPIYVGGDNDKKIEESTEINNDEKTEESLQFNVEELVVHGNISESYYAVGENLEKIKKISFSNPSQVIYYDLLRDFEGLQYIVSNNPQYYVEDGVVYNSDKTQLIYYCKGKEETTYTAPETVTVIQDDSIRSQSLKTIDLSNTRIQIIPKDTFWKMENLEKIELPNSLLRIENDAFHRCSKLKSIYLPDNLEEIGNSAFRDCSSLQYVNMPETVKYIGESAFSGCSALRSIVMPAEVAYIHDYIFSGCESLQYVKLPEKLKLIGKLAFSGCKSLGSLIIPKVFQNEVELGTGVNFGGEPFDRRIPIYFLKGTANTRPGTRSVLFELYKSFRYAKNTVKDLEQRIYSRRHILEPETKKTNPKTQILVKDKIKNRRRLKNATISRKIYRYWGLCICWVNRIIINRNRRRSTINR